MTKTKIGVLLVLSLALLALLCSCGNNEGTNNGVTLSSVTDFAEYIIVRGDSRPKEIIDAVTVLKDAIEEKTGVSLKNSTDYKSSTKEILVGKTRRQQSVDALNGLCEHDYVIKQVENKIVIIGGSDSATVKAVDYFIENYIDAKNKTLNVPSGEGFMYIHEYKLQNVIIGGVSISDFKVRVDSFTKDAAKKFCDDIKNIYLGCELKIDETEMDDDSHYFIFDSSSLDYGAFAIEAADGNITISGSVSSFDAALKEFYSLMDRTVEGVLELAAEGSIRGSVAIPEIPYKSKEDLLKILEYLQESDELIVGQHLAGGLGLNSSIEQYTTAVGEGPAIMDIDMVKLKDHKKEFWSSAICEAVEYASKGGIITTMHHWENPLHPEEGFRGRLDSLSQWQEVLTPGTELNKKWHEELDRGAEFLGALIDAGVSVIFRPMHEANAGSFWFGAVYGDLGNISAEDMVAMWEYVYNYYTNDCGLDNLLWSYSPNITNSTQNPLPVNYYYPGDEYCDIVGLDWYTGGQYEIDGPGKSWENLLDYRKPAGLAELGLGGALKAETPEEQVELWNCEDYVGIFERMRSEGKAIAFVELYAGKAGAPSHVGKGEALANYKYIVSLEEMPALIEKVLGE